MSYTDFSSWPREQEQSFEVYERHANESSKTAFAVGIASAVIVFFAALGIYAGVEPDRRDLGKDMNMSNLTKKEKKGAAAPAAAPAPAPDKQEAPKTDDKPKADDKPTAEKPADPK